MDLNTRKGRSWSGNRALAVRRRAVSAHFSAFKASFWPSPAPFRGPWPIYRVQFPVMRQQGRKTCYDAQEPSAFAARRGIVGVGL